MLWISFGLAMFVAGGIAGVFAMALLQLAARRSRAIAASLPVPADTQPVRL